jgi:hypothetical protein
LDVDFWKSKQKTRKFFLAIENIKKQEFEALQKNKKILFSN